jgi:1,4-alpha-glucan branching enzyme
MKKMLPENTGKRVRFELAAEAGREVFVAGTFNGWSPTANPLKDNPDSGHFKAEVRVPPGTHEYKFVVDGLWVADPKCSDWIPNGYGSLNSVLRV